MSYRLQKHSFLLFCVVILQGNTKLMFIYLAKIYIRKNLKARYLIPLSLISKQKNDVYVN